MEKETNNDFISIVQAFNESRKLNTVESTNVKSMRYNDDFQLLFVTFNNNLVYVYQGVEKEIPDRFEEQSKNSDDYSIGKDFNKTIVKQPDKYKFMRTSIESV